MSAPGLEAVDDLCRLVLAARRLGCRVRIEGASEDLRALLSLAGVDTMLSPAPSSPDQTGVDLP